MRSEHEHGASDGSLLAAARPIEHYALDHERGAASAVQVDRLDAAEPQHDVGQLRQRCAGMIRILAYAITNNNDMLR